MSWTSLIEALAKLGGLLKELFLAIYLVSAGKDKEKLERAEEELKNVEEANRLKRDSLNRSIESVRDSLRDII